MLESYPVWLQVLLWLTIYGSWFVIFWNVKQIVHKRRRLNRLDAQTGERTPVQRMTHQNHARLR